MNSSLNASLSKRTTDTVGNTTETSQSKTEKKRDLVKVPIRNKSVAIDRKDGDVFQTIHREVSEIPEKGPRGDSIGMEHSDDGERRILRLCIARHRFVDNCLPDSIGRLSALKHLDASSSYLESIPASIGFLEQLEILNLSNNSITDLPHEIGNLVNLKHLNLNRNPIFALPSSIGKLKNLGSLYLGGSKIQDFPDEFWSLANLHTLNTEWNCSLSKISSASIQNMQNLRYLSMAMVDRRCLPEAFGNLTNLVSLTLSGSPMRFPQSFKNLQQLSMLNVRDVFDFNVQELEICKGLPNLQSLWIVPPCLFESKRAPKDSCGFLLDFIQATPSLIAIDSVLEENQPKLAYALACNRFHHRFQRGRRGRRCGPLFGGGGSCDEKQPSMLPIQRLWPHILSNAVSAFELSRVLVCSSNARIEPHDAAYMLLLYGRESFVQALLDRSKREYGIECNESKRHTRPTGKDPPL